MRRISYIGHESQLYGVEEHRLIGGKGDGMRLLQVKNGCGLEFTISADRCADISRLSLDGVNFGYFSPCGYVAPAFYDGKGAGFLKSFTAGFLTTCGLTAVGSPCVDEGEELPLHGTIANCPAEWISYETGEEEILIRARVNEMRIFGAKLVLKREICCSLNKNEIRIRDVIENQGSERMPLMLLYHMNMGYPLLSEKSILHIPSKTVSPRNAHAAEDLDTWNVILPPTPGFEEQCYFHSFDGQGLAALYNPEIRKGLAIQFNPESLDYFVEWKMMGERDYVLGLEPGNCHPDGRDRMRAEGRLKELEPGESKTYELHLTFFSGEEAFKNYKEY